MNPDQLLDARISVGGSRLDQRVHDLERENEALRSRLSDIEVAVSQAQFALNHDSVTGLPNRRTFVEQLQRAAIRARFDRGAFAVLAFRVTEFQAIQDAVPEALLRRLLAAVVFRIRQNLRPLDLIARADEDLFLALLPLPLEEGEFAECALRIAQRVHDALLTDVWFSGQAHPIATRYATAICPNDGDDAYRLLHHIEARLAADTLEPALPAVPPFPGIRRPRSGLVERSLRKALDDDVLLPHYQPQISASSSGRVLGAEALARWPLPDGRFVSPSVFVPTAESAGLAAELDECILRSVCGRIAQWQTQNPDIRVAVNVSERFFHRPDLVRCVRDIVESAGARPQHLLFEITENVMITDFHSARRTLSGLRELGIAVALDDFGTGYSSLSYLRRLPLDAIKIDQSFVHELGTCGEAVVVRGIIAMAASLNLQVIAEGVESTQQADILRELGCQVLQGFLYSKAVPAADFEAMLAH